MSLLVIGSLLGGLGLFQLGMLLMTDGLKLAAGKTLRNILENSTRTPIRGVLSGALITSMVQSSSAVTVATIGFVNAGLMKLGQAVSVIYGSNIGTTMTSWLVALIGFKLNIKLFALPAIGLGMMFRLLKGPGKQGAIGEAVAGFGVFFMGIDVLKASFEGMGAGLQLTNIGGGGLTGVLLFLTVGFLLTLIMQSSSAALAVALTAAAGGVVPLQDAAAVVIGANVGTTSTAALAVIGATPNAKRVAAAHVAFNIITGIVALALLPLLLKFLATLRMLLGQDGGSVTILAMFHTLFNILGVLLLWPFTKMLIHRLKKLFRSAEEDEAKPVYLDRNVISTPVLAMHALEKELVRLGKIAIRMAKASLSIETRESPQLVKDKAVFDQLEFSVADFVYRMQRSHLPADLDDALPSCLRITGYYASMTELAELIAEKQSEIKTLQDVGVAELLNNFKGTVVKMIKSSDVEREGYSLEMCEDSLQKVID
ncbi:MAG: Na/Pi cotransporter family protein, partial [Deltaproteobacteria bacterium]|nr:Na/Pi cotransporter family protein [Deltaproteobacteria bacterium]